MLSPVVDRRRPSELAEDAVGVTQALIDRHGPVHERRSGVDDDVAFQAAVTRFPGMLPRALQRSGTLLALGVHRVGFCDQAPSQSQYLVILLALPGRDRGLASRRASS